MSRNVRATARLEAQVRALIEVTSCSSSDLAASAASLAASGLLCAETIELLQAPDIGSLAQAAGISDRLDILMPTLAYLKTTSGDVALPKSLVGQVGGLLANLGQHLAHRERDVVTEQAVEVLRDELGYQVVVAKGDDADGIEAWRGDELLLLAVADGGEVLSDQAGAADCDASLRTFERHMGRHGVAMQRVGSDDHGAPSGPMIAAAAAFGEVSLALGVAGHATVGSADATHNDRWAPRKKGAVRPVIGASAAEGEGGSPT